MTDEQARIQRLREALELAREYPTLGQLKIDLRDVAALLAAHAALVERVRVLEAAVETAIPEYEYLIQMLDAHAPYELVGGEQEALDGLRDALATAAPPPAASPAATGAREGGA